MTEDMVLSMLADEKRVLVVRAKKKSLRRN